MLTSSHDVSWGTKGEHKVVAELGAAVVAGKGTKDEIVEVEMPADQLDIDSGYEESLANLRQRRTQSSESKDATKSSVTRDDYYREIRTRLVLTWAVSNFIFAMALTEVFSYKGGANTYLTGKSRGSTPLFWFL